MITSRRNTKAKPLECPMFGSMAEMSARTGVPLSFLKDAKRRGCPFVHHGRCDPMEFFIWEWKVRLEGGIGDDDKMWGNILNQWRAEREKIKLDQDRKETITFSETSRFLAMLTALYFSELERLHSELPASAKGKTEIAIHEEVGSQIELIKRTLSEKLDEWQKKGKK